MRVILAVAFVWFVLPILFTLAGVCVVLARPASRAALLIGSVVAAAVVSESFRFLPPWWITAMFAS